jgi:uncharacterized OB-fold protein
MERQVLAYRCRSCATLHYPFRMRCKQCGNLEFFEFDPEPLTLHGRLLTFTRVHNLPAEYEVETLGLGVVELDEGVRLTGQLDVAEPAMGMEVTGTVEVVRHETYDDYWGVVFRAA